MRINTNRIFLSACLTLSILPPALAQLDVPSLQKQVAATAKNFKGHLGVGVIDLKTGESWYLNSDEPFRMMSVVKVPVAIVALHMVDEGKLKLDQEIPLTKSDIQQIRNSYIPDTTPLTAKSATLESLIDRSIRKSNNGTVDVLTKLVGGPKAITTFLKDKGISGIRVDSYEAVASLRTDKKQAADLPDSATPRAACTMLNKLQGGQLLSAKSTDYLLDLMRRCETGEKRIRAGISKEWIVAHKTGTGPEKSGINVAVNDVAIITRPDKSSLILTVFIADAKATRAACESKAAEIAHAVQVSAQ